MARTFSVNHRSSDKKERAAKDLNALSWSQGYEIGIHIIVHGKGLQQHQRLPPTDAHGRRHAHGRTQRKNPEFEVACFMEIETDERVRRSSAWQCLRTNCLRTKLRDISLYISVLGDQTRDCPSRNQQHECCKL
jgi:hypothetical protein